MILLGRYDYIAEGARVSNRIDGMHRWMYFRQAYVFHGQIREPPPDSLNQLRVRRRRFSDKTAAQNEGIPPAIYTIVLRVRSLNG